MKERLQKILSARSICSRRKAEEYIEGGLVKVNGKIAKLGDKADPEVDKVEVDGKVVKDRAEMKYYLLNKAIGVEIRSVVPKSLNGVFPVGRLDKDSSGLLILTNDGVLAYRLTHPKFYHEKEYEVKIEKPVTDGVLKKLSSGLIILGKKTKPAKVRRLSGRTFSITLTEGRNRQIRRMCQKVGCPVKELKRVRIVTVKDDKLKEGEWREMGKGEVKKLLGEIID